MSARYHWTIDGRPSCRMMTTVMMDIYHLGRLHELNRSGDLQLIVTCSADSVAEVDRSIEALHKYLPDRQTEVRPGECPDYLDQQASEAAGNNGAPHA